MNNKNANNAAEFLVSVIIPCYNRVDGLRKILEKLCLQVCDFNYEIIIVDDGSPTPILPQIEDLIEKSSIRIECVRKENGGPASARNFGVDVAEGEYLVLVDDDMDIESNFLQAHIDSQKIVGGGLISCIFEYQIEGKAAPFHKWYENRTTEWREAFKKGLKEYKEDIFIPDGATSLTTANLSVSKSDYILLGRFDSEYESPAVEDQDFALRAQKKNIAPYITFKTKAIQKEAHDSLEKVCQRQMRGAKDTVRLFKRFAIIDNAPIAVEHGKLNFENDSVFLIGKKLLRSIIILPLILPMCFRFIAGMEKIIPNLNLLQRFYNVMVSAYTQKGLREGLIKHSNVQPLPGWEPKVKV